MPPRRRAAPLALVAAAALAAGGALGWRVARQRAVDAPAPAATGPGGGPAAEGGRARYEFAADPGALGTGAPAVSPDGTTIVFRHDGPGGARLYARRVDDLVPRPLEGTDEGEQPFFSPDGAWVGFFGRGAVRRVRVDGGPATVVAELPAGAEFGGGSWGAGDVVVFADRRDGALYRAAPGGGAAVRVGAAAGRRGVQDPHSFPARARSS
jgi:hypothetical protein